MTVFKKFFKVKTGLQWEDRYSEGITPEPKKDAEGKPVPADEGWFQFERPTGMFAEMSIDAEISMREGDEEEEKKRQQSLLGLDQNTAIVID
jgi:hypothetical protein